MATTTLMSSATRRGRLVALAAGAGAVALAALAVPTAPAFADTPTPTARPKSSFVLGIKQEVDSLNPYVGVAASSYEIYQLVYDTLNGYSDKDFSAVPMLAERWETSADGKTWTYHIRQGVKWSDGQPLTAKDVAYSFNRALTGEAENSTYSSYVGNITKVTATDDATVVMETKVPTPVMLRLAVPILPEHVWKGVTEDQVKTYANDKPVGSGPFTLVEHQPDQYRFTANKSYWAGAPKIDELVIRVFANEDAMAQALRKGEIDMVNDISPLTYDTLSKEQGITVSSSKYSGFSELAYNLGAATDVGKAIGDGNPVLKDKAFRLALDQAIDRKTLVEKVYGNRATPATGVIPALYSQWHWQPPAGEERAFDLAKANSMLDAAGYPKGADGIRTDKSGKKISLRLFGRSTSEFSQKDVQYIAGWFKEIGLDIKVDIMSEEQLTEVIGQGEYDMFHWGWVVEPDPDFQLSVFTCGQRSYDDAGTIVAGWSDSFYCDEGYDKLYEQQQTMIDPAQRTQLFMQMQKQLYDEAVYSMLYYYDNLEAYRSDRFTNITRQPADGGSIVFQYGTYTYRNIEPVADAAPAEKTSTGLILGIAGGAVALVVVIGVIVMLARRGRAAERE